MGLPTSRFFSIVNTTVLQDNLLFELMVEKLDLEEPRIWTANYKLQGGLNNMEGWCPYPLLG